MPATIQVILHHDVQNVGKSGELVRVRPGFARNFLIPRDLAVPATTAAVNRIAHEKAVALAKADKANKGAKDVAAKIDGVVVQIARRTGIGPSGEEERLFGSVTTKDIQTALKGKGIDIDKKKMTLAEPIKALGTFDVTVKLLGDITATFKVEVIKAKAKST
jgi:large subunit ribosomal protein L9